jgi:SAM-dependent methyltransferase
VAGQADADAALYESARPVFSDNLISQIMAHADLTAGKGVLEIGAGTGQLTAGLLRAKLNVMALEPAPALAALLARRFEHEAQFSVQAQTFASYPAPASFAALFAANAFHNLDAATSYAKARELLAPQGALCLLWNFQILADAAQQARLNEALSEPLTDLRTEPEGFEDALGALLAQGRDEMAASGCFEEPRWALMREDLLYPRADYARLLASYAAKEHRDLVEARVAEALPDEDITVRNFTYASVARRAA